MKSGLDKQLRLRLLAGLELLGRAIKSDRMISSAGLGRARIATLESRFEAA
jgi:LuxR family transcriptional regulator, maltose regulon positive regulatory protein